MRRRKVTLFAGTLGVICAASLPAGAQTPLQDMLYGVLPGLRPPPKPEVHAWVKPGKTPEETASQQYACMRETGDRMGWTPIFFACMNAQGWFYKRLQ